MEASTYIDVKRMSKLIRISYRELRKKLTHAGYLEIRTSRHPVFYSQTRGITIPIPRHGGDVPIGTLRAIVREMGLSIDEFNGL